MKITIQRFSDLLLLSTSIIISLFIFNVFDYKYSRSITNQKLKGRIIGTNDFPADEFALGWYAMKKNFKGKGTWGKEMNFDVISNKYGFRSKTIEASYSKIKPADILFLGDSATLGAMGAWDYNYVGQFSEKNNPNIINAGLFSYSLTPYLYQYKKVVNEGLLKENGLISIAIDISDLQDEANSWEWKKDFPYPTKIQRKQKKKPFLFNFANEGKQIFKSKLDNFGCNNKYLLRANIYTKIVGCPTKYENIINYDRSAFTWKNHKKLKRPYYPIGIEGGLKKISKRIDEIGKIAKDNNHKIVFLIYPWPAQIVYNSDEFNWIKFNERLCDQINEVCIGTIDTVSIFRESSKNNKDWYSKYFVKNDIHLNREGNKVLYEAFINFLKNKNLLLK